MSQNILHTGKRVHNMALQQIQAIPEELFDVQPPQFNNTIRWHVGHMIVTLNYFLYKATSFQFEIPEVYGRLFSPGTKPSDWTVAPPTKEELLECISGQLKGLEGISAASLEEPLKQPVDLGPMHFENAGELVNFALIHEAMHLGNIASMLKVIKQA